MLTASDREIWVALNDIPSYESTKGTSKTERAIAIEGYKSRCSPKPVACVSPYKTQSDDEVEDPFVDSGSEYVPSSDTSDSDTQNYEPQVQNIPFGQYIMDSNSHSVETKTTSYSKSIAFKEMSSFVDTVKTNAESSKEKTSSSADSCLRAKEMINIIDQYVIPRPEGTSHSDEGTLISNSKEDDNQISAESTNYSVMKFSDSRKYNDEEVKWTDVPKMSSDNGRNDLFNDSETNFISDSNPSTNGNYDCEIPLPNLLTFQSDQSPRDAENARVLKNLINIDPSTSTADKEVVDDRREQMVTIDYAKKNNGKRVRDKVHSCYFCNNLYKNNLPRHYQRVHTSEIEVAQIFAITDLKKRRERLINLERCGDFYHNCEVLTLKKGELILTRRPSENELQFTAYNDYGPCPQCLGFMLKRHIWHHLKYSCNSNKYKNETDDENQNSNKRLVIAESTALINGILSRNISKEFIANIINKFKNDEISEVCKGDESTVRYGAFLYEKYSTTQSELIRQNMRQLARLIIEVKRISNRSISLGELLCPENFDVIISATKQLCHSHQQITGRPEFGIPSLALKLGYSLKKCVAIERGQALRRGDLARNKKLLSF
ncbi:hypothetical protein JTB14_006796 [Gonioctena quinquepunctata]|nr:hypothetical protein JTB14_006796 [Gonioctena quinquepunctata]